MKNQQVAHVLQEIAGQEVPANLDLWPAIRAQVQPRQRPSWRARLRLKPTTRLGWAGLIAALLLAFSAGAYAVGPLLSEVFQMEAGIQHIEQANLGQEVNLSQTVDGINVTLHRVYADANRIVIGYTVRSPSGFPDDRVLFPVRIELTDSEGTVFSAISGVGRSTPVGPGAGTVETWTGNYVDSYDASVVQGTPEALHLRLAMEVETHIVPTPAPSTPGTREDRTSLNPMIPASTAGPFIFDFSVPFVPGCTIEVQQEAKAGGVALKLERVVVTPSATRAILCFEPPGGGDTIWTPVAALDVGDGQQLFGGVVAPIGKVGREECHRVIYPYALTDHSGLWRLTVTELVGTDLTKRPSEDVRLSGPWVFRFRVP